MKYGQREHERKKSRAARRELARVCQCGETYGRHGATSPHTIGDSCAGFAEAR